MDYLCFYAACGSCLTRHKWMAGPGETSVCINLAVLELEHSPWNGTSIFTESRKKNIAQQSQ